MSALQNPFRTTARPAFPRWEPKPYHESFFGRPRILPVPPARRVRVGLARRVMWRPPVRLKVVPHISEHEQLHQDAINRMLKSVSMEG